MLGLWAQLLPGGRDMPKSGARSSARLSDGASLRIGKRVRDLMKIRNMTQAELVKESGLGRQAISQLVRGQSNPRLATLIAVAQALSLNSIEELLAPHGLQIQMESAQFEATSSADST